jgi:hypothetical protein
LRLNEKEPIMKTMKPVTLIILIILAIGFVLYFALRNPEVRDESREIRRDTNALGNDASNGVRDAYDTTKDTVRDGYDATKDTVRDGYDATKDAAQDAKDKVKDAAE